MPNIEYKGVLAESIDTNALTALVDQINELNDNLVEEVIVKKVSNYVIVEASHKLLPNDKKVSHTVGILNHMPAIHTSYPVPGLVDVPYYEPSRQVIHGICNGANVTEDTNPVAEGMMSYIKVTLPTSPELLVIEDQQFIVVDSYAGYEKAVTSNFAKVSKVAIDTITFAEKYRVAQNVEYLHNYVRRHCNGDATILRLIANNAPVAIHGDLVVISTGTSDWIIPELANLTVVCSKETYLKIKTVLSTYLPTIV